MSRLTQSVGPFIGGVSQAPAHLRATEFFADMENGLAHPSVGAAKRPGTRHVARLGDASAFAGRSAFTFVSSDEKQYIVVLGGGGIRVFDALTGEERPVVVRANGTSYLTASGSEPRPFDVAAAGGQLYVVNRTRAVQRENAVTAALRPYEVLLHIAAADFLTGYTVGVDGVYHSFITTSGESADRRALISTEKIATDMAAGLQAALPANTYILRRDGSAIYIRRVDGGQFGLHHTDGLASRGIVRIPGTRMGSVPTDLSLPASGVEEGFTVKLDGDPSTGKDDAWMVWRQGQWRECAEPGSSIRLKGDTMPHVLTVGGALRDAAVIPEAFPPAVVRAGASLPPKPGLVVPSNALAVSVAPFAVVPAGAVLTLTANGQSVSVTAPNEMGWQAMLRFLPFAPEMAGVTAFKTMGVLDAYSAMVLVYREDGQALAASLTITTPANVISAQPGAAFGAFNELIGLTAENLTTGQRGTITSNTYDTITVSGATFAPRDRFRVIGAPDTFVFTPVQWADREAGSEDSNPFPSFVGAPIGGCAVVANRLLLTSGESVVLSAAGEKNRFFRASVRAVLDADPIDVRSASTKGQPIRHVALWNERAHLVTDRALVAVASQGALTPRSVVLPFLYEVTASARCRPVVVGNRLFVARRHGDFTQLLALAYQGDGAGLRGDDATEVVPTFLKGRPLYLAADTSGVLLVVTDVGLYAMREVAFGRSSVFAWGRWTLDAGATVLAASAEGGNIALVVQRADGVYLDTLDTLPA